MHVGRHSVSDFVNLSASVDFWSCAGISCISYFLIAVIKQHAQDNFKNKAFHWAYVFRGLESVMMEGRHGGRKS